MEDFSFALVSSESCVIVCELGPRIRFFDFEGENLNVLARSVRITRFLRPLRGGSQPMLVQASDGFLYVVKFNNNLQGPNLAFNEAIGTELYRACQLPVPIWRPLLLTPAFLNQNPDCWIQTETGRLRPTPGICFGSRFLGQSGTRLLEILPGTFFVKVRNRMSFWQAWIVDVCARHADNRQAIFIEQSDGFEPVLMDHGHLFSGADGKRHPHPLASRYLDPRIYPRLLEQEIRELKMMRPVNVDQLWQTAEAIPDEWKSMSALENFSHCLNKLSSPQNLAEVVDMIVELGAKNNSQPLRGTFYDAVPVPLAALAGTYPAA